MQDVLKCSDKCSTRMGGKGQRDVYPGDPCPDTAVARVEGVWMCWAHAKRAGWRGGLEERVAARWARLDDCAARVG